MTNEEQAALIDAAIARAAQAETEKSDVRSGAALQMAAEIADQHPEIGFAGAAAFASLVLKSTEATLLGQAQAVAEVFGPPPVGGGMRAEHLRMVLGLAAATGLKALDDEKRRREGIQFANAPSA